MIERMQCGRFFRCQSREDTVRVFNRAGQLIDTILLAEPLKHSTDLEDIIDRYCAESRP